VKSNTQLIDEDVVNTLTEVDFDFIVNKYKI